MSSYDKRVQLMSMGMIIVAMSLYDLECLWTWWKLLDYTVPYEYAVFRPTFLVN